MMNGYSLIRRVLIAVLVLITSMGAHATSVGISTIEQPVNLGERSDRSKIPLGKVLVESNYRYGVHRVISEARPCPDGAMHWKGGAELNQNLASVFGISVEPADSTMIVHEPVTIRLKAWKKPGYSPYTKEQVLSATLWCLIRSAHTSAKRQLDVRVVAEGDEDKFLEKKFTAKYFDLRDESGKVTKSATVKGSKVEIDARGIAWVVFSGVAPEPGFKPLEPAMIVSVVGGESGDSGLPLLPVWGSGRDGQDSLKLNQWTANMLYPCFNNDGLRNANSFLTEGQVYRMRVHRGEDSDAIDFVYPRSDPGMFAANVYALIVSLLPTAERPLVFSMTLSEDGMKEFASFADSPGWKKKEVQRGTATTFDLECEIVWDAKNQKIIKGSVPLMKMGENFWIESIED